MIKICLNCKKPFNARLQVKKYCSDACAHAHMQGDKHPHWKGGQEKITCAGCGVKFQIPASWVTERRYCSKDCYTAHMRKRQVRVCVYCKEEFYPDKDVRQYCSRACSDAHKVKEHHSCWKGGISYEPYPPTFDDHFKRMIRERDNYTCAICKNYGKEVHHINYVKMDTNPENCITLCRSCHPRTNHNRSYWITFFANLSR